MPKRTVFDLGKNTPATSNYFTNSTWAPYFEEGSIGVGGGGSGGGMGIDVHKARQDYANFYRDEVNRRANEERRGLRVRTPEYLESIANIEEASRRQQEMERARVNRESSANAVLSLAQVEMAQCLMDSIRQQMASNATAITAPPAPVAPKPAAPRVEVVSNAPRVIELEGDGE